MAETVSWNALRELAEFQAEKGRAISFYLDLDPRTAPTAGDAATRVSALLTDGERHAETSNRGLTHDQRLALKQDFSRIRDYFDNEFQRDGAHGVAIFSAGMDNVWRPRALIESVPDRVRVGREFYLAPLVPLVGRGEGAIVAFVGRERGELFRLRSGRLDEIVDRTDDVPGRHDQGGWSQARFQRHIEKLVAEHLKDVAEELDRSVRRMRSPKVIVVSSEETRAEFEEILSNGTKSAVVGWTSADAHASPQELLALTSPILDAARALEEAALIARWRAGAGRGGRAASGWAETLEAASDARVETLLYEEGADHEAWQCPACGRLSASGGQCPLDGTETERGEDGLDLTVHQTVAHGGTVWAVTAHEDLGPAESVGALLRY
ncbi:MAG TPA: Vms1/Ankzf1 family peptidyl-tRNA hydrolase [Gaiellaceae bacterium]|nr:Vms1/Ankzf1 family peptidyl-tRNA hydrolase [Gaiellaceae bacterium]